MDEREKLIEAAREFRKTVGSSTRYYPKMDNSQMDLLMADFHLSRTAWVKFDWDDKSTWPQIKGQYNCREGGTDFVVADEWDGEKFTHYGVYGYWALIPPFNPDGSEKED